MKYLNATRIDCHKSLDDPTAKWLHELPLAHMLYVPKHETDPHAVKIHEIDLCAPVIIDYEPERGAAETYAQFHARRAMFHRRVGERIRDEYPWVRIGHYGYPVNRPPHDVDDRDWRAVYQVVASMLDRVMDFSCPTTYVVHDLDRGGGRERQMNLWARMNDALSDLVDIPTMPFVHLYYHAGAVPERANEYIGDRDADWMLESLCHIWMLERAIIWCDSWLPDEKPSRPRLWDEAHLSRHDNSQFAKLLEWETE